MDPIAMSFDLVIRLAPFNEKLGAAWTWSGMPMTEVESIHKRIKRLQKQHGARMTGWRIVLMELNQLTGEVKHSIVEQS